MDKTGDERPPKRFRYDEKVTCEKPKRFKYDENCEKPFLSKVSKNNILIYLNYPSKIPKT